MSRALRSFRLLPSATKDILAKPREPWDYAPCSSTEWALIAEQQLAAGNRGNAEEAVMLAYMAADDYQIALIRDEMNQATG